MKLNNETKVGILAAVAITLLILGFNLLKGEKIFVSGFELKSYYQNIDGLATGNPILYNGFRVGTVKTIDINESDGLIEVRFSLKKGLEIPVDSRAVISNADLLGSKAIRIDRGIAPEAADNGGVLQGENEKSLEVKVQETVFPIIEDVDGLLKEMERFMGWMNNTMDASAGNKIDEILDEFVTTSRNFSRSSSRVDTLLGSVQNTVSGTNRVIRDLGKQTETVAKVMDNTAKFTDSLAAASSSVKQIVESSAGMIKSVEGITKDINDGKGTLGKLVKDEALYNTAESAVARVDSFAAHINEQGRIPADINIRFGRTPEEKAEIRRQKDLAKMKRKAERKAK